MKGPFQSCAILFNMKKTFGVLLLFLAALLPCTGWAIPTLGIFDPIIAAIQTPIHYLGTVFGGVGATAQTADTTERLTKDASAPGLAAAPIAVSDSSAAIKTAYNSSNTVDESKEIKDALTKPSRTGFNSFRDVVIKIKEILAGNSENVSIDELQEQFKLKLEKYTADYFEKALEDSVNTFVNDVASCNTPQLDVLLPTFDLTFGLGFCDYGKMFNDLKRQSKSLRKLNFKNMVKVNGMTLDKIMDDPSALEKAIQAKSPGTGHQLAISNFSNLSMKATEQYNVDSGAALRTLGTVMNKMTKGNLIGQQTVMDHLEDQTKATAAAANVSAAAANATVQGINALNGTTGIVAKSLIDSSGKLNIDTHIHMIDSNLADSLSL
jgi:hypothetical protein